MHPEVMLLLAHEHRAELARAAAWESQVERAAAPRPDRDRPDEAALADPPAGQLLPQLEA